MIANDDLAHKTCHIVGTNILLLLLFRRINVRFQSWKKYITHCTFGKLHDWPIRIHANERAG